VSESRTSPKNKPNIKPLIDPIFIDQGNNQNKGQYGWIPEIPNQFGCHKKMIGIEIKEIKKKFFKKNLYIYIFTFKIWTQSIACGCPKSKIFAAFLVLNFSSTDLITPIGIFGGKTVLAGEDETKSPTFISASLV